jgi:hypothetical protein
MIVGTIASACIGLAAPMAFAAPAKATAAGNSASQSSTTYDVLSDVERTLKRWKVIEGGGSCSATSVISYDSSSGELTVDSRAHTTNRFHACRARARFTLETTQGAFDITRDIPTACSRGDLSCSPDPSPGEPGQGWAWDLYTAYIGGSGAGISDHVLESR